MFHALCFIGKHASRFDSLSEKKVVLFLRSFFTKNLEFYRKIEITFFWRFSIITFFVNIFITVITINCMWELIIRYLFHVLCINEIFIEIIKMGKIGRKLFDPILIKTKNPALTVV